MSDRLNSLRDHAGSVYAWRRFMALAQQDITEGRRSGVIVKWATADPQKVQINRFVARLLKAKARQA